MSQDQWEEARKRMLSDLEAVFWQDLGISKNTCGKELNWILDEIFKPEYLAVHRDSFDVWRQDDNGNQFQMRSCLSHVEAKKIVVEYEAKGHKQHYWVKPSEGE